jgi:hypothetical protein
MGKLFGRIYGDVAEKFRVETWRRYVEYAVGAAGEDER